MNEELRQELLAMAAEDEAVRARLAADGALFDAYNPEGGLSPVWRAPG